MSGALVAVLFMAFGIWLLLYIFMREKFLRRFFEISLAIVLAFLFKKIGIADELAWFSLGLTIAMAFFIRKI